MTNTTVSGYHGHQLLFIKPVTIGSLAYTMAYLPIKHKLKLVISNKSNSKNERSESC